MADTPAVPRWVRVLLIVAASMELYSAAPYLFVLTGDDSVLGEGLNSVILAGQIITRPVLALAALVFSVKKQFLSALYAFAATIFMTWLKDLQLVTGEDLHITGTVTENAVVVFQVYIAPAIAVAVAILARQRKWLTLAALLAVAPTLLLMIGVIGFTIGVAIYGF